MNEKELALLCAIARVQLLEKRTLIELNPSLTGALRELDKALTAAEPEPSRRDSR